MDACFPLTGFHADQPDRVRLLGHFCLQLLLLALHWPTCPVTYRCIHALCELLSIAAGWSWAQGAAAASPLSGNQIRQLPTKTIIKFSEMHLTPNFYNDRQDWLHKCMTVFLCNAIHMKMPLFYLCNTIMFIRIRSSLKYENYIIKSMTNQFNDWIQRTI